MKELYIKKNADYGNSFHETWRLFGMNTGLVYLHSKLNRLLTLLDTKHVQQVEDEKIDDTLIDLANYALMTEAEMSGISFEEVADNPHGNWEAVKIIMNDREGKDKVIERLKGHIKTNSFRSIAINALKLKVMLEEERERGAKHKAQSEYSQFEKENSTINQDLRFVKPAHWDEPKPLPDAQPAPAEPQPSAFMPCIEAMNQSSRPAIPVQILLEEGGIMPRKATDGSAAYDLFAPDNIVIQPGRNVVPLNFRMALPKGIGATPNPRSGFTLKGFEGYRSWGANIQSGTTGYLSSTGWMEYEPIGEPERMNADVQWGLIDMDYRGVCGVLVISHESRAFLLAKGTRFAQMCFQYYEEVDFAEVDKLDETTRGDGGFNSTGTK